jgi:hypothetical protein
MGAIREAARSAVAQASGDQSRAVRLFFAWFKARVGDGREVDWIISELEAEGYEVEAPTLKRIASDILNETGPDRAAATSMSRQRLDEREYPTDVASARDEISGSASHALVLILEQEWNRRNNS